MRIAQIAPLAESVPPSHYGGTERVVSWLSDELVALGDKVTLFASSGSKTKAELVAVSPKPLRLSRPPIDPMSALTALLECVARRANDFDVIHCHLDWIHIPLFRRLGRPFVTTLHGRLGLPHMHELAAGFADAPFVSISNSQRAPLSELNFVATIYHGLPERLLLPNLQAGSYLAFLGRFTPEKGPHVAIRLARKSNLPLRIAAKIPRMQTHYFKEQIEPLLDGDRIEFVGEVNESQKQDFLGNALAVLFPIDWPEPFGLVMIEAMACGTPIIAWRRGSVPEIIDHGVSGFIVDSEAEAIDAIARIATLDRRAVRATFERRFTARRMAESYRRGFERLIARGDCKAVAAASRSSRESASELSQRGLAK
jgi:glycosyltransferase involved in cell wall biosynthesis